jgi:AraC-like DNA-binding protein
LVRHVLHAASREGAQRREFARQAGFADWAADANNTRFPAAHLARLWQVSVARLEDQRLGLRVAGQWRLGACGITDYVFDTSASLGDAFSQAVRYTPLLNSGAAGDIGFADGDGHGTFRCQIQQPDPAGSTAPTEFVLASLLRRARHATGHPVAPVHVGFAAAAPPVCSELVEELGTSRIDFGTDCTTMTFRRADLDRPLVRSDPVLAGILRGQADAELVALQTAPRWVDEFREVLAGLVDDQTVLLAAAARRLAVSPRTLQRLLEREGTSWRAEVDAARQAQAVKLLAGGVSQAGAAARLGYSDARALRRAIRRWTQQ